MTRVSGLYHRFKPKQRRSETFISLNYTRFLTETDDAVKVQTKKGIDWFPKSVITLDKDEHKITMPAWFFLKRYAKK
jgi:hypothetical protein